ncbi:MAG: zf-HC2 domain-containing protein [Solirubrobacteraceae bacterium]
MSSAEPGPIRRRLRARKSRRARRRAATGLSSSPTYPSPATAPSPAVPSPPEGGETELEHVEPGLEHPVSAAEGAVAPAEPAAEGTVEPAERAEPAADGPVERAERAADGTVEPAEPGAPVERPEPEPSAEQEHAVLSYCRELLRQPTADEAAADTFAAFRLLLQRHRNGELPDEPGDDDLLTVTRRLVAVSMPDRGSPGERRQAMIASIAAEPQCSCRETALLLAARASDAIAPGEDAALSAHLAACPECRGLDAHAARAERAFRAALPTLPAPPTDLIGTDEPVAVDAPATVNEPPAVDATAAVEEPPASGEPAAGEDPPAVEAAPARSAEEQPSAVGEPTAVEATAAEDEPTAVEATAADEQPSTLNEPTSDASVAVGEGEPAGRAQAKRAGTIGAIVTTIVLVVAASLASYMTADHVTVASVLHHL